MPRSKQPEQLSMLRVVIDTNLFVRGLMKGPVTLPLIGAWKAQRFQLVTSESLIEELFEVLARPRLACYFTKDDVDELARLIYERGRVVVPEFLAILKATAEEAR
ncbi:MAG TPA: putative toxin-antitoxin system toxin component, PIN family [Anaerolineae bacterium]|nr:putative toxin-antitoxin system toxin component, PIN family [Anaerolineae bacterium]